MRDRERSEDRKERRHKYSNVREMVDKRAAGFTAPYLKMPEKAQLFKPKSGVMLLDILPFEVGEGNPYAEEGMLHWERTFWVHKGVGANKDAHLCLRKNFKEKCPICEFRNKIQSEGEPDEELLQSLAPRERQLFNVINRKDPDKGVQIWDISYHLFGKLLTARLRDADEDDGWDLFFTLDKGYTLKIGFGEKSYAGRAYFEAETIDFKRREDPYDDDILEDVHALDSLLVHPDYDKLKEEFLETSEESSSGKKSKRKEEEDEEPPKKRGAGGPVHSDGTPGDDAKFEVGDKVKGEDEDGKDVEGTVSKVIDEDEVVVKDEEGDKHTCLVSDLEKVEEDEEPPKKKRRREDDPEDQETPRGGKFHRHKYEEPEDEEPPKKKKKEDEEPDDWSDFDKDEKPKSKRKEEEDEEPPKKKRRREDD